VKLIVGISGATGVIYGVRILELLKQHGAETHLLVTDMGKATIAAETDYTLGYIEKLSTHVHNIRDLAASISSGSFRTDGMIVAPCSVRTLSAVANCANDNLLTRAADVCLKERRKLVLLFRESPLHAGHCQLMLDAVRNGAILMPPAPVFYTRPQSIADLVDQTVGRVLDLWGIEIPGLKRWEP
jgi:4-hydroxy-3-polyprenylbenzoate decarboxylase